MAPQLITATMGEQSKATIHPFFSKGARQPQGSSVTAKAALPQKSSTQSSSSSSASNESPAANTTTRANTKAKRTAGPDHSTDSNPVLTNNSSNIAQSLEVDPNTRRRKRQKRTQPVQEEDDGQDALPPSGVTNGEDTAHYDSWLWMSELRAAAAAVDDTIEPVSEVSQDPEPQEQRTSRDGDMILPLAKSSQSLKQDESLSTTLAQQTIETTGNHTSIQPPPAVKVLHFNPKTGTIGSPPKKLAKIEEALKGKASGAKRAKKPKSLIVVIKYNQDVLSKSAIGENIDQILQSVTTFEPQLSIVPKAEPSKPTLSSKISESQSAETQNASKIPKPDRPPKATHPFFLGKIAADVPMQRLCSKEKDLAAEPSCAGLLPPPTESEKLPTIGRVSPTRKPNPKSSFMGFGTVQTATKVFPGALSPAWPWQGMVHIRGTSEEGFLPNAPVQYPAVKSDKKSKNSAIQVLAHEDVLTTFAAKLSIEHIADELETANIDQYQKPVEVLRLPIKHFKSGHKLQQEIRPEVRSQLPAVEDASEDSSSDDVIQGNGRLKSRIHPAINRVYRSIATSLSAFDRYECETQSWIQKYAPYTAEEVLQSGREATILRDWLQTLRVKLVETGHEKGKVTSSTRPRKGVAKKKKKIGKDLDAFIVSGDEDADDMDEISEPDEDVYFTGNRGAILKTVIRSGDITKKGLGKLTNAIVISGPCGSGKTAAVYAVAKELDFEIFEINPGSRRSGKDILEKVGDMTRNHLVQRTTENDQATLVSDDEMQRVSDALDEDLKSGRQGTMNSFFKPAATTKSKLKAKNTKTKKTAKPDDAKPTPKKHKQSLILIEEADILYEEDKQFWATVIALISQSKRPVIMTCNDESVIPLQSLSLHAILRFTPAPMDLAVDHMLLIAANEGHILKRPAVEALYESRGFDLRGSLTELQFWCQFAVGDPKNGLEWRYKRWPPGCDMDSHGNTVRTISEGTYDTGMGWLGRDFSKDAEEERLRQAWQGWQVDAGNWHETLDITKWADKLQDSLRCKADEQLALNMYEYFVDAMSTSDVCAGRSFASGEKTLLDHAIPELPNKVRDDFTLGYELLHADDLVSYDSLGIEMSFWLRSRAWAHVEVDQLKFGWKRHGEMNWLSEVRTIEKIRRLRTTRDDSLTRRDLSIAFDGIAEDRASHNPSSLDPSVFDRTMTLITLDVAPFIRSIVSYDAHLQQERLRLSNLVSAGGRSRKRKMRTTRAANAALEGGIRGSTRPDKYFGNILNPSLVLRTGKQSWQDAIAFSDELLSNTGGGSLATNE